MRTCRLCCSPDSESSVALICVVFSWSCSSSSTHLWRAGRQTDGRMDGQTDRQTDDWRQCTRQILISFGFKAPNHRHPHALQSQEVIFHSQPIGARPLGPASPARRTRLLFLLCVCISVFHKAPVSSQTHKKHPKDMTKENCNFIVKPLNKKRRKFLRCSFTHLQVSLLSLLALKAGLAEERKKGNIWDNFPHFYVYFHDIMGSSDHSTRVRVGLTWKPFYKLLFFSEWMLLFSLCELFAVNSPRPNSSSACLCLTVCVNPLLCRCSGCCRRFTVIQRGRIQVAAKACDRLEQRAPPCGSDLADVTLNLQPRNKSIRFIFVIPLFLTWTPANMCPDLLGANWVEVAVNGHAVKTPHRDSFKEINNRFKQKKYFFSGRVLPDWLDDAT